MRLGEQVRNTITAPAPKPVSEPPMNMGEPKADGNGSMNMSMSVPEEHC